MPRLKIDQKRSIHREWYFAGLRRRAKGATRLAPAKPSPGVHHRLLILECSGSGGTMPFPPVNEEG